MRQKPHPSIKPLFSPPLKSLNFLYNPFVTYTSQQKRTINEISWLVLHYTKDLPSTSGLIMLCVETGGWGVGGAGYHHFSCVS